MIILKLYFYSKLKRCFQYWSLEKILHFLRKIMELYLNYDIKDCINLLNDTFNKSTFIYNINRQYMKFIKKNY